jgi:hypothetical protein
MQKITQSIAIATVLAIPTIASAQSDLSTCRAEVRAEQARFKKAAPADANTSYPDRTQAAEAKMSA